MRFKAMFLLMLPLISPYQDARAEERYAALECQSHGRFVLVNFYPDYRYKLTWGQDDGVFDEDIAVTRHNWGVIETFVSPEVSLELPVKNDGPDDRPRVATFRVRHPFPNVWTDLKCLMFAAD